MIDVERLHGFTGGDVELERELAALFLSTAEEYLERMARALEAGGDGWAAAAHTLKGASANLGAPRLAALAAAAEAAPPSSGVIAALRRALDDVRTFFERDRR